MTKYSLLLLLFICSCTKVEKEVDENSFENISPEDEIRFKADGFVRYSDFGASGDGKTDDIR